MQGLYAIIDVPHPYGLAPVDVARALLGDRLEGDLDGAAVLQLRAKHASTGERVDWAQAIVEVARPVGVPVFINDDVEAALASGAGVHLGQGDLGAANLDALGDLPHGVSTHDLAQLRAASRLHPTYLAYGPVMRTTSKIDAEPTVGWDGLLAATRIAARPVVAIGGLDAAGGRRAIQLGAAAVAMIGALIRPDLAQTRAEAQRIAAVLRAAAQPLELDEVAAAIPVVSREQLVELARWADDLSIHVALGLPSRFRPRMEGDRPLYRHADVLDLLHALGKQPDETWQQWHARGDLSDDALVLLRRR